jgi:hypothetical protein
VKVGTRRAEVGEAVGEMPAPSTPDPDRAPAATPRAAPPGSPVPPTPEALLLGGAPSALRVGQVVAVDPAAAAPRSEAVASAECLAGRPNRAGVGVTADSLSSDSERVGRRQPLPAEAAPTDKATKASRGRRRPHVPVAKATAKAKAKAKARATRAKPKGARPAARPKWLPKGKRGARA